ncbi:monocarboxylate transporter 12-like isoform X2 [Mytilus edulis]|uniref:monocarboxylate transporter 12-like isoform X2 n=1 Tax=Mytilus edulis TaxID=6550 RepID=UPI0039F0D8A0
MSSVEKSLIETELIKEKSETVKKDSKVSWFICFNGWLTQILILGVLHGFGVFFVEFTKDFKSSKSKAAWIGSLAYGLSMTFGPIASMLVNRFGNRVVMVFGAFLCSASILTASFVHSIEMLFVTFSVFYGIGTCLCITPIMTIATQYFDKYLTIAVGIMTAGSSFGTLIYAPMSQAFIDAYGWRNTFRCYSGLCALSAICSLFIKPISNQKKTDEQKLKQSPIRSIIQDLKLWKNRVFVIWTIAITLVMFGFYIPYVHLVAYAEDCGIPPEKGAIFIMMLGACTAFGRILFGKIIQYGYLNRLAMHQFSMVVTGTGVMLLPYLKSFTGISAYVICIGLVDGCYVVLLPVLTATLVGVDNTVLAWGFLVGTSSVTFTAGPPLAGALYDMMGSYDLAFHLAGLPIIGGALVLFLIPWAQRTSKTDNVMIAVSEYNVADDYDFGDDVILESRALRNRQNSSSTTLTDLVRTKDLKTKGQTRFKTKRYKDQETSTSPTSIHVPIDINEALAMFHENAQMIATLLETSSGHLISQTATKTSEKSRSDMIQNMSVGTSGPTPHNVISIMSVPGGVAIGTFGGNVAQNPSESSSSNIFINPNSQRMQTQTSDATSQRSRTFDDPYRVASDMISPVSSKVYQIHHLLSPDGAEEKPNVPTHVEDNTPVTSPHDTTISGHMSRLITSLVSPSMIHDKEASKSQTESTASGQQSPFENNYIHNTCVSPCYISSPPKLQSIPEIPAPRKEKATGVTGKHSIPEKRTYSSADHNAEVHNTTPTSCAWVGDSSSEPTMCTKLASVSSSSSTSHGNGDRSAETKQTVSELDVFTHLFTDDNV